MRPRRILTADETSDTLDQAAKENALVVVTVQENDVWHTFKCRFLERDPNRKFFVLDYQETHGTKPIALSPGQYVGISFRNRSRKVMFATVVEAKGRYLVDGKNSVPAVRFRWPEDLTELQRRVYYRTPLPAEMSVMLNLWPGGVNARKPTQQKTLSICTGELLDLSCGGTLVQLNQLEAPDWPDNQSLGVELHLPDGRPPMLMNAYFRGARYDEENQLCAALQFVGLELTDDGRSILQRLARFVQKIHRMSLAHDTRAGRPKHETR